MKSFLVLALVSTSMAMFAAQEPQSKQPDPATCPLHEQHTKGKDATQGHDHESMLKRGEDERGMGFSQSETTHHFLLQQNGGAIQVEVNDPKDTATRETVRKHLQRIAESFSEGDFSIPRFVHDKDPDGVKEMKQLGNAVQYRYEELPQGGRVALSTKSKAGLAAIHSFLRFQIYEHRTGDPLSVPK